MAILRTDMTPKFGCAGSLLRRHLLIGVFACWTAISALAQTEAVTVTLLASYTNTTDPDPKTKNYLSVAAANIKSVQESQSWLYFDASALPDDKDLVITNVQLRLVPNAQLLDQLTAGPASRLTGMAITVAPAKASSDRKEPRVTTRLGQRLSYDVPEKPRYRLVSPPRPTDGGLRELRSDSVTLSPKDLLQSEGERRYVGLVLLPQPNASRRVYYGLNAGDVTKYPGRVPRLIITYNRKSPSLTPCASEPSPLALTQSDGRLGDSSSCNFMPNPTTNAYISLQVASGSLTEAPVVYRDRLYVVRKEKGETRLEELTALGGLIASVPLNNQVREGSPMVVDRFGRLRIITNTAIITAQLKPPPDSSPAGRQLPASVDVKPFTIVEVPTMVVPGPDGTLYIAKHGTVAQGIFALNPEVGELDASGKVVLHPQKLWEEATWDEKTTRITLSPDGRVLYALALFTGGKSRFIAIDAQTGDSIQLLPRKVDLSGNTVTWVSGMQFGSTVVGSRFAIGTLSCTVEKVGPKSLTCKEDLGTQSGVSVEFPDDLKTFRNPVVAQGLNGVDFIYLAGHSGSAATLWGMRNDPAEQNRDSSSRITPAWEYPLEVDSDIGQPILDPTAASENKGLSGRQLDFLKKGPAGTPKLLAVEALKGNRIYETDNAGFPADISTERNPVVDSAGNVILWAKNTLYGFSKEAKSLFTAPVASAPLQLLFGPGGTLYAVSGTTVSALIPSFQQSDTGPTSIYSPTHLYMTGSAARQGVKAWTLEARGSVILGENFSVKIGETLSVCVNASQLSVDACK